MLCVVRHRHVTPEVLNGFLQLKQELFTLKEEPVKHCNTLTMAFKVSICGF